jgi:hypothetical protein
MTRAALLVLSCLVASCTTTPMQKSAPVTESWGARAPPPQGAGGGAAYGKEEISLDCVVNVDAEHLTVIGLLPSGPRVFTVGYDGRQVSMEKSRNIPETLHPELLLNDLQLAFWPRDALQAALEKTPWRVTEPDPRTRRLTRNSRLVSEVHYATADPWTGRVWLVNFERGYSITIDSQPLQ